MPGPCLRLHPAAGAVPGGRAPAVAQGDAVGHGQEVHGLLSARWMVDFDDTQSIGRRYRRQDEVGTPYCVTVDFESLDDQAVTIRERDTTEQVRLPLDALVGELADRLTL